MSGKIYMIKENNEFVEMEEKKHALELDFQKLIEEYPDLIPGDQIDGGNPQRWLHVGSEVNFPIVGGGNIYWPFIPGSGWNSPLVSRVIGQSIEAQTKKQESVLQDLN